MLRCYEFMTKAIYVFAGIGIVLVFIFGYIMLNMASDILDLCWFGFKAGDLVYMLTGLIMLFLFGGGLLVEHLTEDKNSVER